MNSYDSQRISNYLVGIYCETRYKLSSLDIEWQIENNRIVIKTNPAIYTQIKPYIDSQCTLYRLKQTKRTNKGRINIEMQVENGDKLLRSASNKLKISEMDAMGGSSL